MDKVTGDNFSYSWAGFSAHKLLVCILLITAVFGYIVSYDKLYAFHLALALYWGFVITGIISIRKSVITIMAAPIIFFLFVCVSLFWAPSIKNGLMYIFYFLCGYTILFSIVNYTKNLNRLDFVFRVLSVFFLSNFFVGLLETTGNVRLPASPYYGMPSTWPSGFNANLNNFGFVFIAVFPFFILHPMRCIKMLAAGLALWFAIKLESKGFLLGLMAFPAFYFITHIKTKSTWHWVGLGLLGSLALSAILFSGLSQISLENRAFSAFSQIEKGVSLISSGNVMETDSTGTRATMYMVGLKELSATNGLGLGVAGIGSNLALYSELFDGNMEFHSFHNFFLEMLVDFGVVPFFVIIFLYLRLALFNIKVSKKLKNEKLRFFNKASGLALLTMVPASISPSSIIYIFTFWMVIGFALATFLVTRFHDCWGVGSIGFNAKGA